MAIVKVFGYVPGVEDEIDIFNAGVAQWQSKSPVMTRLSVRFTSPALTIKINFMEKIMRHGYRILAWICMIAFFVSIFKDNINQNFLFFALVNHALYRVEAVIHVLGKLGIEIE